jgi:hypothetical protein
MGREEGDVQARALWGGGGSSHSARGEACEEGMKLDEERRKKNCSWSEIGQSDRLRPDCRLCRPSICWICRLVDCRSGRTVLYLLSFLFPI